MPGNVTHVRRDGDYSGTELHTIMATLTGRASDDICEVAAVVVMHMPSGKHELTVVADGQREAKGLAELLNHAAAHLIGACDRCRAQNARGTHEHS